MNRVVAAVLGLALAMGAFCAWSFWPGPALTLDIPEGLTARETARLLEERGVVRSARAFRVFLKASGFDRHLKPGTYVLRERMTYTALTRKLTLGLSEGVKVTLPEGFRASQIAERLEASRVCSAADFMAEVSSRRLEGKLFPSTYHFSLNIGARRAADAMLAEFERRIVAAYAAATPKPTLSLEDALTVASIVEREAVLKSERPIIAAVYLNRLAKRMPLQADPTVQYALGRWKKGLTRNDLQIDSPYNTYARRGLPPGPICSPGLEAFLAVLSPAKTEALYFVADMTGGHLFSTTNEEHSKARMLYKKNLKREKERLRRESARPPAK